MAKRKRKKSSTNNFLTYTAWILAVIALGLGALVGGYYIGYEDAKKDIQKQTKTDKKKRLSMLKKLEDASSKKENQSVNTRLKMYLKKRVKLILVQLRMSMEMKHFQNRLLLQKETL